MQTRFFSDKPKSWGFSAALSPEADHLQSLKGFLLRPFRICADVQRSEHHLIQYRRLENLVVGILKHQADIRRERRRRHFVHRAAEDRNLPLCRLQQSLQQFYECRLAGAVLTDDGGRPPVKFQRDPSEDLFSRPVGKGQILYGNPDHLPLQHLAGLLQRHGKWELPSLFASSSRQTRV